MDSSKQKQGIPAWQCKNPEDLPRVAQELIDAAGDKKVWLLEGEMGAGKTTLIKTLAQVFGVTDTVSSPTYSLVNEYGNESGQTFYHFDLYRINDQEEAQDIGIGEYFYSGNLCWVEWPSKIPDLLPDRYFKITIFVSADDRRMFQVSHHE
ncbi:tRNA (adenosine(37)-N6)-threonylcarbamoyltransferase complex ATPase subunit type 1 TsaE [Roseivirga sp. BDSF3-8]|uniref:tRNA (adenosine(37)-N6)-threonylcarbamoyltransferase complex ATPase subunit type 1 TsaE n=1 Tax=Roseivirga sp. BDSF3-8 TaxID=3241598 RepID=UPI003531E22C